MKAISLSVWLSTLLALTGATAQADMKFWINASGDNAGRPGIGQFPKGTGTGYIWGRPDADETLVNLDLNLLSDSDDLAFTGVNIVNPVITEGGLPPKELVRYEFVSPGNVATDAILGFGGFSVTNDDRVGAGIGPRTSTEAPIEFLDPYYDAAYDAFLIASFDYSMSDDSGQAGLWLQIGQSGLNYWGGLSADVDVIFGDPPDPPLNGESGREINSATVDARVGSAPCEPGQFCNLNFEDPGGTVVPHWNAGVYVGSGPLACIGPGCVGNLNVLDTNDGWRVLEGSQSLAMTFVDWSGWVSQTGDVPADAVYIQMLVSEVRSVSVSLDGANIPLSIAETTATGQLVFGRVADFAGTTATLRIKGRGGMGDFRVVVDAISFVAPEATTATLALIAMLVFGVNGYRHPRVAR